MQAQELDDIKSADALKQITETIKE